MWHEENKNLQQNFGRKNTRKPTPRKKYVRIKKNIIIEQQIK